ncbi:ferritin-like domain-containing protein [Silvimonas sp. JCM 19000]
MTTDRKDNLLDWLRDAHAMEQQAEQMLKAQSSRLEHYPDLKARIDLHLQETLGQQKLLEACINRLGGSHSVMKDLGGKLMAFGQAIGGMTMSDEVIKGSISGYVFENLEIATYTVLIEAARAVGDVETQRACEQILPQEQAMAQWLLEHLPDTTYQFLVRAETPGITARR